MLWQVEKWFDDTVGWLAGGARVGGVQATSLPAAAVVVVVFAVAEIVVVVVAEAWLFAAAVVIVTAVT